jgi:ABC-type lipoprotein release transport system permease subunit
LVAGLLNAGLGKGVIVTVSITVDPHSLPAKRLLGSVIVVTTLPSSTPVFQRTFILLVSVLLSSIVPFVTDHE